MSTFIYSSNDVILETSDTFLCYVWLKLCCLCNYSLGIMIFRRGYDEFLLKYYEVVVENSERKHYIRCQYDD